MIIFMLKISCFFVMAFAAGVVVALAWLNARLRREDARRAAQEPEPRP